MVGYLTVKCTDKKPTRVQVNMLKLSRGNLVKCLFFFKVEVDLLNPQRRSETIHGIFPEL